VRVESLCTFGVDIWRMKLGYVVDFVVLLKLASGDKYVCVQSTRCILRY